MDASLGLHAGHVQFLRRCRQLGNRLIVGVNTDDSIRQLKGSGKPIFSLADRMEILRACRYVDEVISFDRPTACELIECLKPEVYAKGRGNLQERIPESETVIRCGGRIVILDGPDISTTQIIERIVNGYQSQKGNSADSTEPRVRPQ